MAKATKLGTLTDPVRVVKRALKFASKDANRPILTGIHLDGSGEVVATDSYRLYVESGKWDGQDVNIDLGTAGDMAKCKVKGNDTAELWRDGGRLIVKMGDGTEVTGAEQEGEYPKYGQFFADWEPYKTVAYVDKRLKPILAEHAKAKRDVRFDVRDRDLEVSGTDPEEPRPQARFEKSCDGGDAFIRFNPAYIKSALEAVGFEARVFIASHIKPAIVTPLHDMEIRVLVMPIRLYAAAAEEKAVEKEERMAKRKEAEMEKARMFEVGKAEVIKAIEHMAIDRAANDPDGRVEGGKTSIVERDVIHGLVKGGRLVKSDQHGAEVWFLDGEFACWVERRYSKRKVHLAYPELKPIVHRGKAAWVTEPNSGNDEEKASEGMEKAEKKQPKKAKEKPKKAAAKKPAKKPAEKSVEKAAAVVSLETMKAWCAEREDVIATQKREGAAIRVYGETKPYREELVELGFRWTPNKQFWYAKPTA